jgi:hypothetical protein
MQGIMAAAVLANGLRSDFLKTYTGVRKNQSDGRVGMLMSNVGMTNRYQTFAYMEAAPHVELWRTGDPIPTDAMGSVSFTGEVWNYARRIPWMKWDRKDDQVGGLYEAARGTGESAGLLPERFLFDMLDAANNTPGTLPAMPLAPDGAALFATTAAGAARFGATDGNIVTGTGVASTSTVLANYYTALNRFALFQDGKGQPLIPAERIMAGAIVVYAQANSEIMETAFLQRRQGRVMGTDAGVSVSNIVQEANRNVELWASPRLTGNDWYVALKDSPTKPFAFLDREGIKEYQALEDDNNSDHVRSTGQEFIQFETRCGALVALPYGIVKVNN